MQRARGASPAPLIANPPHPSAAVDNRRCSDALRKRRWLAFLLLLALSPFVLYAPTSSSRYAFTPRRELPNTEFRVQSPSPSSGPTRLVPLAPFSWDAVQSNAAEFAKDRYTPTLLALVVDFVRRRSSALDVLSAGGVGAGLYLGRSEDLQSNLASAISLSGRDCRRPDVLLTTCLLTSGETAFLQEWFAWHILQVQNAARV
jgi:hypothetical protein